MLGQCCFYYCHSIRFESRFFLLCSSDLPLLQSITLQWGALRGDDRMDRKRIDSPPFNFSNSLQMKCEILL